MSGVVAWTRRCPSSWPVWARSWACTPGSLTLRLVRLNKGFKVEPVLQGKVLIKHRPGSGRRHAARQMMRQRLVRLHVNHAPVVLAQTLAEIDGLANDWHFWRGLGSRSLGTVLFSDPLVKRGAPCFARLPLNEAWVQRLLPPALKAEMNRLGTSRVWYARCARFSRKPDRTPLWVMEVFLPQLEQYL